MPMSSRHKSAHEDHVVLGKLTSPYGVKGWLRVYSYTSPMQGILDYDVWVLRHAGKVQRCSLVQGRMHGKGLVALLAGVEGREQAEALAGAEILLPKNELPEPEDADDFYWHQLVGLQVVTLDGVVLGRVDTLFETGANDVLVVKSSPQEASQNSGDRRERLVPYLYGDVVHKVDLEAGVMTVDWDPEF